MKRSSGFRSKTRHILKKSLNAKGMRPLGYLLMDYKVGDKVLISIDPATHKGQPHRRFHGKRGIIREKRGRAYVVSVENGSATRTIITLPQHIRSFPA